MNDAANTISNRQRFVVRAYAGGASLEQAGRVGSPDDPVAAATVAMWIDDDSSVELRSNDRERFSDLLDARRRRRALATIRAHYPGHLTCDRSDLLWLVAAMLAAATTLILVYGYGVTA